MTSVFNRPEIQDMLKALTPDKKGPEIEKICDDIYEKALLTVLNGDEALWQHYHSNERPVGEILQEELNECLIAIVQNRKKETDDTQIQLQLANMRITILELRMELRDLKSRIEKLGG